MSQIIINDNKVNPFPDCSFEEFNLDSTWYLPQHLSLLKKITKNYDLEWDFSSKLPEERGLYERIYHNPWNGELGLLFYRKVRGYWFDYLPEYWMEHKILNKISKEEMAQWNEQLLRLWSFQHEIFLKETERR